MKKLVVKNTEISMKKIEDRDYISLTDMLKAKDGVFFISLESKKFICLRSQ